MGTLSDTLRHRKRRLYSVVQPSPTESHLTSIPAPTESRLTSIPTSEEMAVPVVQPSSDTHRVASRIIRHRKRWLYQWSNLLPTTHRTAVPVVQPSSDNASDTHHAPSDNASDCCISGPTFFRQRITHHPTTHSDAHRVPSRTIRHPPSPITSHTNSFYK